MHRYVLRRLLSILPTVAFIASVVFVLLRLVPGDPALLILGMDAPAEEAAALRRALGLDRPLAVQYLHWLRALATGDLGESLRFREPVARLLWERLPVTVSLTAGSMLVAVAFSLPLGILAALRPWSAVDLACLVGAQVGLAIPSFWLGILLILGLAVTVRWFPLQGYVSPAEGIGVWARHLVLPALALGVARAAVLMRLVRA
ncbi:MAG: ABC transporter permease, partial [Armatimonadetes bacterium]|nr:ABC transporter permease [Armatimonadota bacterium]